MGQKNILINTATNFLASPSNFNENYFLIYVTYSKKDAILLKEKIIKNSEIQSLGSNTDNEIDEFDIKNLEKSKNKSNKNHNFEAISNKKFCIFTLNENPTSSEFYYLPKIALNYAQNIQAKTEQFFGNKSKSNILFCFDDISIFALKEKILYDTSKLYQVNKLNLIFKKFLKNVNLNIIIRLQIIFLLIYLNNVETGRNSAFLLY